MSKMPLRICLMGNGTTVDDALKYVEAIESDCGADGYVAFSDKSLTLTLGKLPKTNGDRLDVTYLDAIIKGFYTTIGATRAAEYVTLLDEHLVPTRFTDAMFDVLDSDSEDVHIVYPVTESVCMTNMLHDSDISDILCVGDNYCDIGYVSSNDLSIICNNTKDYAELEKIYNVFYSVDTALYIDEVNIDELTRHDNVSILCEDMTVDVFIVRGESMNYICIIPPNVDFSVYSYKHNVLLAKGPITIQDLLK